MSPIVSRQSERALLKVFMQKISRPIVHFPIHIHQRRANKQYIRVARLRSHTHLSPHFLGATNSSGFMFNLQSLAIHPAS